MNTLVTLLSIAIIVLVAALAAQQIKLLTVGYAHLPAHLWPAASVAPFRRAFESRCCDKKTVRHNQMPASVYRSERQQQQNGDGVVANFGRYHGLPTLDMDFGKHLPLGVKMLTAKEWSWSGVSSPHLFCGTAVAQVQFASGFFLYCYVVQTNEWYHFETEATVTNILGLDGATPSASPMEGCFEWLSRGSGIMNTSHCYDKKSMTYQVRAKGISDFEEDPVVIELSYDIVFSDQEEAMAIVFPFGPKRVGSSVKMSGTRVKNVFVSLKRPTAEKPFLLVDTASSSSSSTGGEHHYSGMLDYTRSQFPRHTTWTWIAFSGQHQEEEKEEEDKTKKKTPSPLFKRFGVQITTQGNAYNTTSGTTAESTIWLDGKAHALAPSTQIKVSERKAGATGTMKVRHFDVSFDEQDDDADADSESLFFKLGAEFRSTYQHLQDLTKNAPLTDGMLEHQVGVYRGEIQVWRAGKVLQVFAFEVPGVLELHDTTW